MNVGVIATTEGPDGSRESHTGYTGIVLDPSQPVPNATFTGDDKGTTDEDTALTGDLVITDADAGDTVFLATTLHGSYGDLTIDEHGHWSFTPNAAANALSDGDRVQDVFTVESKDGTTHQIQVDVTGANDGPTATAAPVSEHQDVAHTFAAKDFGFTDPDSTDSLDHVTITGLPDPSEGSLTLDGAAVNAGQTVDAGDIDRLVFTPASGYVGRTGFTYTVSDGDTDSPEQTAQIEMLKPNSAPVVGTPISVSVDEDHSITVSEADLLANATDADGDSLSVSNLQVAGQDASVTNNGDGTWTITPKADFHGDVQLTYEVGDGTAKTPASYALEVASVGDGLTATDDKFETHTQFRDGVVHANLLSPGIGNEATVSMWVRVPPGSRSMGLAGFGGDSAHYTNEMYVDGAGQIHTYSWTPWGAKYLSGPKIDDGQWHHIVYTVRAPRPSKTRRLATSITGGQFWTPITPQEGAILHAESQYTECPSGWNVD
jgi:VCBS repeat-containing protein